MHSKACLSSVGFIADHSKAVGPMLFEFCMVLWSLAEPLPVPNRLVTVFYVLFFLAL